MQSLPNYLKILKLLKINMSDYFKLNNYKFKKILSKIDYKKLSCLDIGGGQSSVKIFIKNTKKLDIKNADIKFNLINDFIFEKKLPFKNSSFDMVVISQILEHTLNPDEIFKEAKRIAKKYILFSLPNDLTLDNRIRLLLGKSSGFSTFGHLQMLNYNQINLFLKNNLDGFAVIDSFNLFACSGGRIFPDIIRKFLAKYFPSLFCKEKLWLLEKNK
jgi:hypothetical protein